MSEILIGQAPALQSVGPAAESAASRSDSRRLETGGPDELAKLQSLAAQFEAVLLGQMLKEMRSSMFEENDESGFGGGPLADSIYTELSQALGKAGGFGLAGAIRGALERQAGPDAQVVSTKEGTPAEPIPGAARDVTSLIKGSGDRTDYKRAGIGFGDSDSREPEQ